MLGRSPRRDKDGQRQHNLPKHLAIPVQQPWLLAVELKVLGLNETAAVARAPRSRPPDGARAARRGQLGTCATKFRVDRATVDATGQLGRTRRAASGTAVNRKTRTEVATASTPT